MPLKSIHLWAFFSFMFIFNVYGHLGYELLSPKLRKSKFGQWINTGTAHHMYHHSFKGNYGLYFLFWDRWMGTLRSAHDE